MCSADIFGPGCTVIDSYRGIFCIFIFLNKAYRYSLQLTRL